MAEVVAADPAHPPSSAELSVYCKQRLAVHKVPFKFSLVPELAYTSTGKIKRW
jgi:acyl-CoA synthetase (AMP-forming)/AMP-acid ligase II